MSDFRTKLLRKFIRRLLVDRNARALIQIIWDEARSVWYEDNPITRYAIFEEHLDTSYRREIDEFRACKPIKQREPVNA